MKVLVVTVYIKPAHRKEFVEEMLKDAIGSEKTEAGCLMFNVVEDDADPNTLHLFEVYRDAEAVDAHMKTTHFQRWVEATKEWHAKPALVAKCTTLYPPDGAWQKRPAP